MTSEELARLCFAARPMLWALAIIAVLVAAVILVPKIFGTDLANVGTQISNS
jgi:hypothetical protein